MHVQEFECLLISSDPHDLGPFHNWRLSLYTITDWEGGMPLCSSEQWVSWLLHESIMPSRLEFWEAACLMGGSVPKVFDIAIADISRFHHWLPWLGKDCSSCSINIGTCCLTLDWSFHEEHPSGKYTDILSPCWFEGTEGCIIGIDQSPEYPTQ